MQRVLLKSKIHRATVTGSDLTYEGSISVDTQLMKSADLLEFERVDIYNCNNGERFSTYVIPGQSGEIALNGAAARLVQPGDKIIIASYVDLEEKEALNWTPKLIFVNEKNSPTPINALKSV